jgi:hypothetical protein
MIRGSHLAVARAIADARADLKFQGGPTPKPEGDQRNWLRQVQNHFDAKKITEQPSKAIMSRQAAEVGPPESEYLTVPEMAKILRSRRRRNHLTLEQSLLRSLGALAKQRNH